MKNDPWIAAGGLRVGRHRECDAIRRAPPSRAPYLTLPSREKFSLMRAEMRDPETCV